MKAPKTTTDDSQRLSIIVDRLSMLQSAFNIIIELADSNKHQFERLQKKLTSVLILCDHLSNSKLHNSVIKTGFFSVHVKKIHL